MRGPLAFVATLALLSLGASGCGSKRPAADPSSDRPYPCVLHPPAELTPDFVVEQHVEAAKDGRSGAFDAVVQKRGDELLVVGLGPMGMRAFVLRQRGVDVSFEQRMGPPLPFPPRNVLVDVHRAFFKRLPLPEAGSLDGTHGGVLDGEGLVEVWRAGSVVERRFSRPGEMTGSVRVFYGPGCGAARCEPSTIRLVNEWFGYELRIDNRRFHSVE